MLFFYIWTSSLKKLGEGWQRAGGVWSWDKQDNIKHRGLEDSINCSITINKNLWLINKSVFLDSAEKQRHGLQQETSGSGPMLSPIQDLVLLVQLQRQDRFLMGWLTMVTKSGGEGGRQRKERKRRCWSYSSLFGAAFLYWFLLMASLYPQ